MKCGIYCIKNQKTGKVYVGQSSRIEKRWIFHRWQLNKGVHPAKKLQKDWSIDKSVFVFQILEECEKDKLPEKEIEWIAKFDSFKNGYNGSAGGRKVVGSKRTPEHCQHISESLKGRTSPMKGKHFTEDHKAKISRALMGNKNTPMGGENHASKKVRSITTGMVFECAADAGRFYGSNSYSPGSNICACCRGKREFAFGQQWEFI